MVQYWSEGSSVPTRSSSWSSLFKLGREFLGDRDGGVDLIASVKCERSITDTFSVLTINPQVANFLPCMIIKKL